MSHFGYLGRGTTVALLRNNGAGFDAPATFPVAEGPYELAASDFNGDGFPDLAVASNNRRLTVLLNDRAGGFGPAVPYLASSATGDVYTYVTVADLDRDGDVDLLRTSNTTSVGSAGAFALFRNHGDGTFAPSELIQVGPDLGGGGFWSLAVGDLNGDGWLDVAGAHTNDTSSGGWSVALSDQRGGFKGVKYLGGQAVQAIALADADRSGQLDALVVSRNSLEVTVYLNPSLGVFRAPPVYPSDFLPYDLDAADLDGDGDLDVATSSHHTIRGSISVLRNRGGGAFDAPVIYPAPRSAADVKLRDLDGDGLRDLLWTDALAPYWARWRRNLGGGLFGPIQDIPLRGCGSGDLNAYDLDRDGDLDVIAAPAGACAPDSARYIDIALNRGDGTFEPFYRVDIVESGPGEVTGGDFNGDGNTDLAVGVPGAASYGSRVVVLLGMGDGLFQPPRAYTVGPGPANIVSADLNGDGVLDLATGNTGNDRGGAESMSVLLGRGDGTFLPAVTYAGSLSPGLNAVTGIVAGDADGDGFLDLLVSNYGSNDVSFFRNRGDGTFEPHVRYGAGSSPRDLVYADFTGDGRGDLAVVVGVPGVAIVRGLDAGAAPAAGRTRPSAGHAFAGLSLPEEARATVAANGLALFAFAVQPSARGGSVAGREHFPAATAPSRESAREVTARLFGAGVTSDFRMRPANAALEFPYSRDEPWTDRATWDPLGLPRLW